MARQLIAVSIAALLSAGCFNTLNPVDMSDAGITARLKTELQARPEINIQYLDIDTHLATVTISGIVTSQEERDAIVRLARRLKGVKQVIANVVVRQ